MKVIKVNLPRDLKYVNIHVLSDWHLGDANCKLDDIKEIIKSIANNKNSYALINGDLINNAIKSSVSDIYSEKLSPMEQIDMAYELLSPIKHKILGVTSGNHENRSYKDSGVDLTAFLATKLGVVDKYDPIATAIYLRVGEQNKKATGKPDVKRQICYKIYMTHGANSGRTEGSKVNALVRLQSVIDADIYIHSHTHQGAVLKSVRLKMDDRNSAVSEEEVLFVNSAAQLSYGGYGEKFSFKPTSTKQPVIHLSGEKKLFEATL